MHTRSLSLRTLLLGAILVWGGGCLGGASAPTRFYTLVPVAVPPTEANPSAAERGPAIGVGPVTLPGYLDRREIVTRRGRDEIELGEFDLWSEPLKDGATRVLGEDLAILLRRSGRTRRGSRWLRTALVQAAWAASHTKATYLSAQYRRLARRRGKKKALVALAHTLLVMCYEVLRKGEAYRELGADYLDKLTPERRTQQLVRQLEQLGHKVTLEPGEAA
jgi:hypothetical protein